jgi:hypothetical protein
LQDLPGAADLFDRLSQAHLAHEAGRTAATLQAVQDLEAERDAWARSVATYVAYIKNYIARPGYELSYSLDAGSTSTMDALASLNNVVSWL